MLKFRTTAVFIPSFSYIVTTVFFYSVEKYVCVFRCRHLSVNRKSTVLTISVYKCPRCRFTCEGHDSVKLQFLMPSIYSMSVFKIILVVLSMCMLFSSSHGFHSIPSISSHSCPSREGWYLLQSGGGAHANAVGVLQQECSESQGVFRGKVLSVWASNGSGYIGQKRTRRWTTIWCENEPDLQLHLAGLLLQWKRQICLQELVVFTQFFNSVLLDVLMHTIGLRFFFSLSLIWPLFFCDCQAGDMVL